MPSACLLTFRKEMIDRHNFYRIQHRVAPLSQSSSLNSLSLSYADQMAQTGVFTHNQNRGNNGENLFMSWSSGSTTLNGTTCKSKLCDKKTYFI